MEFAIAHISAYYIFLHNHLKFMSIKKSRYKLIRINFEKEKNVSLLCTTSDP